MRIDNELIGMLMQNPLAALDLSGKFTLSINSLLVDVPDVVKVTANGINNRNAANPTVMNLRLKTSAQISCKSKNLSNQM